MLSWIGLGRLTFASRIIAIVALMLLALVAVVATVNILAVERIAQRQDALPGRIGAIVAALARLDDNLRRDLLPSLSTPNLSVAIEPGQVPATPPTQDGHSRPPIAWLVRQYLDDPEQRTVIAALRSPYAGRPLAEWFDRLSPTSRSALTIRVGLDDRSHLVFRTRGSTGPRVFGIPPGFVLGIIGALLAAIAIRAIMREARPLRELTAAMTGFASDATPRPVTPRGAPDLARLMASANDMQDRISELLVARSVLLGGLSHDLRTYLTRLRLRMETHPDETVRAKAVRDLEEMSMLLDNALMVAKPASAHRGHRLDLGDMLDEIAAEIEGVTFARETAGEADINGDRVAVRRLFDNLLTNGLRHGTAVTIRMAETARSSTHVTIHVDDDGPGIPVPERERVFEPFHRLDPSRSLASGSSGLGLAIARQIVTALGGAITIGDAPEGGARVTVELPRPGVAPDTATEAAANDTAATAAGSDHGT